LGGADQLFEGKFLENGQGSHEMGQAAARLRVQSKLHRGAHLIRDRTPQSRQLAFQSLDDALEQIDAFLTRSLRKRFECLPRCDDRSIHILLGPQQNFSDGSFRCRIDHVELTPPRRLNPLAVDEELP
jgi:hypothetical protein